MGGSVKFNYNHREIAKARFTSINFRIFAEYKLAEFISQNQKFKYELFAYGGARFYLQSLYSNLNGTQKSLRVKPIWGDPIVGFQNQLTLKRWLFVLQADFGSLFIEGMQSSQLSAFAYFRAGRIISVKAGWNHFDIKQAGIIDRKDYSANVTLSGPSIGIAFHF